MTTSVVCLVCVKTETDARSRWKIRGHNDYNGEGKLIRSEDCSFPGIELQIRKRLERRKHDILECYAIIVLRHAFFYTLAEFLMPPILNLLNFHTSDPRFFNCIIVKYFQIFCFTIFSKSQIRPQTIENFINNTLKKLIQLQNF